MGWCQWSRWSSVCLSFLSPTLSYPIDHLNLNTFEISISEYHTNTSSGIFFFVGPLLLTLGLIFEWIMGNFFPMMVMGLFAVFWLSFGLLQLPTLALASAYSPTGDAAEGAASVGYNATIALFLIVWGFALFTFFIFTLKTNMVFAAIFLFVTIAVWVLSGAYWKVAAGDYVMAGQLQKVSQDMSGDGY